MADTTLKDFIFLLWKSNVDRQGVKPIFEPSFERFIGVENSSLYNDILKTIKEKSKEYNNRTVLFDSEIPMKPDFNFITAIKTELKTMDLYHLSTQNIKMFPNDDYNNLYLTSLEKVVNLAISKESFVNQNVIINFICELLLNTLNYIVPLELNPDYSNKCIYYGNLKNSHAYFLMLLAFMGYDVVYINPKNDNELLRNLSTSKLNSYSFKEETLTLKDRIKDAKVIEQNNSVTLNYQNQMTDVLFSGSGVFRPWQFKDNGTTKPIFFNSTLIDVEQNWNLEAKIRHGFKVVDKTVYIPNFFWEIEGIYDNKNDYDKLFNKCRIGDNSILALNHSKSLFIDNSDLEVDKLKLVFTLKANNTFDIEKIKQLPFYKYEVYNDSTENFILSKINEVIEDRYRLFRVPWKKEDILDFAIYCLSLDRSIIQVIDNFDFTSKIPKLVYFLEDTYNLSKQDFYLIALWNKMGGDIIIFSPAGVSNLSTYFKDDILNRQRLDRVVYDYKIPKENSSSKGFFSKWFHKK